MKNYKHHLALVELANDLISIDADIDDSEVVRLLSKKIGLLADVVGAVKVVKKAATSKEVKQVIADLDSEF
jgi:hypothetical protein